MNVFLLISLANENGFDFQNGWINALLSSKLESDLCCQPQSGGGRCNANKFILDIIQFK